jgi:hypothetical protein
MRTESWQSNTRGLRLVGEGENGSASSPYGPVRVGLTTSHKTQLQVLSELLSCLEKEVETLQSKFCEAYATCMSVMNRLAELGITGSSINTIDKEKESE